MPPEQKLIKADNVDEAAGQILGYLEDTSKGNVIYFDGWSGLGASAVLKVVAGMADLNPRLKFDRIIHVDCSMWKSRRALQKAIAEQLELPRSVMAIFGQRDEEDDDVGVDEASRAEIADVATVIYQSVQGRRILVILLNGSSDYVDLNKCCIPIYGNKLLWTFRGRFRLHVQLAEKKRKKITEQSDVILGARHAHSPDGKWWDLVREEAEEVARSTGIPEPDMKHQMVEDCILYKWALRDVDSIDWGAHASNYWVCDGIIQGEGSSGSNRSAWEIADALHKNMRLDWEDWEIVNGAVSYYQWRPNDRWISATPQYLQQHDHAQQSSSGLTPEATSFFLAANRAAEPSINTVLPSDMFQHPDSRLRVIQLSCCTFSFASPPFLCCRNLRFLLLDHCKDGHSGSTDIIKCSADEGVIEHSRNGSWRACFRKLWVLDLSYTNWYWLLSEEMINVMAELRELNVKGVKHWSLSHLRDGGTRSRTWLLNLAKLRVTTEPMDNITHEPSMVEFPNLSGAIGLKEVILNGCAELGQVSPDALPPLLESFTFSVDTSTSKVEGEGGGPKDASTSAKVESISFRGCAQLKIALLRGLLGSLQELDMSGTAVRTLDLHAVQAQNLKRLFLLGCEKLRAILWPPHPQDNLEVLHRCRIERCPELRDSVFTAPQGTGGELIIFNYLRTFWASQLLKARYIWNWSTVVQPHPRSFEHMESLYLDRCPRLIHVLPLSTSMTTSGFRRLETLDIVWCGDLRKVFRLDTEGQDQQLSAIEFPRLRRIHLHELPMLQHICGRRMSAPMLVTVKIRGCWSLRRLPAVPQGRRRLTTVDCEKEWWDRLEWDGLQASHDASLYKPRHSPYYKKTLPRGPLLR